MGFKEFFFGKESAETAKVDKNDNCEITFKCRKCGKVGKSNATYCVDYDFETYDFMKYSYLVFCENCEASNIIVNFVANKDDFDSFVRQFQVDYKDFCKLQGLTSMIDKKIQSSAFKKLSKENQKNIIALYDLLCSVEVFLHSSNLVKMRFGNGIMFNHNIKMI